MYVGVGLVGFVELVMSGSDILGSYMFISKWVSSLRGGGSRRSALSLVMLCKVER